MMQNLCFGYSDSLVPTYCQPDSSIFQGKYTTPMVSSSSLGKLKRMKESCAGLLGRLDAALKASKKKRRLKNKIQVDYSCSAVVLKRSPKISEPELYNIG